jgi:predicted site-specific integrase-resolvase
MSTKLREGPRLDRLRVVREVGELLAVSPGTVRRYVLEGRLHPIRLVPDGRLRFASATCSASSTKGTSNEHRHRH